jgi:hypothetical protein
MSKSAIILKSRIYKAKIILPQKRCYQFIKKRVDTVRKLNYRLAVYLEVHIISLYVRGHAAQIHHRK